MEHDEGKELTVLGPAPLVRTDADNHLRLQPEGLQVLRQARSPVRFVFAIGGSRCGKSTASNALAFGAAAEVSGFTTGDTFDPVTEGVDVAARQLPDGGTLIVADCEGAFHACGSAHSARGFGTLGLLAYRMCTALLHVSMGSMDERDIEAIGFLAAHGSASPGFAGSEDSELPVLPSMLPGRAPSLFLLVNGARFNLGDAVARKLLAVPDEDGIEAGRNCARQAIAQNFQTSPALEGLPSCEHAAYWPKVESLRKRILETTPITLANDVLASGPDVADRLSSLVAGLNGEEPSAVLAREPQAATESLYRSMHLEPLVEELSRRFAATGAAPEERAPRVLSADSPSSPTKCALDEMLAEFDRRTTWLSGAEQGKSALLRPEVLGEVRARLGARLSGTREALARGRKQGAQARPKRSRDRPPSLAGTPGSNEKENATPLSPGTPSKKNLSLLEASAADLEAQLQQLLSLADAELTELGAAFAVTHEEVTRSTHSAEEADHQEAANVQGLQEHVQGQLRRLAEARTRLSSEQALHSGAVVAEMQGELLTVSQRFPDIAGVCATQFAEVRDAIEAQRLQRQEAGNEAAQGVEARLKVLREGLSAEAAGVAFFKDSATHRFWEGVEELQKELQEETSQRKGRHVALTEVVRRACASLEVSAEIGEPSLACMQRTPRTPAKASRAAATPAAPVTLPDHDAPRMARTASGACLWGSASGGITPVSSVASRSGTPRRTALPAPPSIHSGRDTVLRGHCS